MEGKSIFYDEIEDIYQKLKKNKSFKINNEAGEGKKEQSFKSKSIYPASFELGPKWLARKRAAVSVYRKINKKFVDIQRFENLLAYLNNNYNYKNWWNYVKPTHNRNNPFQIFKLPYSYSSFNAYMQCPLIYKMRFYFKIEESRNLSLEIGSMYHLILKKFFEQETKNFSRESLEKIIRDTSSSLEFEFLYLKKEIIKNAADDLLRYYDNYVSGKDLKVIMEKKFSIDLDGNRINGRIDQLIETNEQSAEIIDFKSGRANSSKIDIESEIQLPLYLMAVKLCEDLKVIREKDLSIKYIFLGDASCRQVAFLASSIASFNSFIFIFPSS